MFIQVLKKGYSLLAICITISILIITIIQTYVVSLTGKILGGFYKSISSENITQFKSTVINGCYVLILSVIIDCILQAVISILGWQIRRTLNQNLSPLYFRSRNYYKLQSIMDNLD